MTFVLWYMAIGAVLGAVLFGGFARLISTNEDVARITPDHIYRLLEELTATPRSLAEILLLSAFIWPAYIWMVIDVFWLEPRKGPHQPN